MREIVERMHSPNAIRCGAKQVKTKHTLDGAAVYGNMIVFSTILYDLLSGICLESFFEVVLYTKYTNTVSKTAAASTLK